MGKKNAAGCCNNCGSCWSCTTPTGIEITGSSVDPCCTALEGTYVLGSYINNTGTPESGPCGLNVKNDGIYRIVLTKTEFNCGESTCYECVPSVSEEFSLEPPFVELCATHTLIGLDCCNVHQWLILQYVHVTATVADVSGTPTVTVIIKHQYGSVFFDPIAVGSCVIPASNDLWIVTDTYEYAGECGSLPSSLPFVSRVMSGSAAWSYDGSWHLEWAAGGTITYTLCDPDLTIELVYGV